MTTEGMKGKEIISSFGALIEQMRQGHGQLDPRSTEPVDVACMLTVASCDSWASATYSGWKYSLLVHAKGPEGAVDEFLHRLEHAAADWNFDIRDNFVCDVVREHTDKLIDGDGSAESTARYTVLAMAA